MRSNYLEFSNKLEQDGVEFVLAWDYKKSYTIYGPHSLITLDKEDIEYFKRKYLPKVKDQFQEELKNLKIKFNQNETNCKD